MYQLVKSIPRELFVHLVELLIVTGIISIAWLVLSYINLGVKHATKQQCRRFMLSFVLSFFFLTFSSVYNPDNFQIFPILANFFILYLTFLMLGSQYKDSDRFVANKYELKALLVFSIWSVGCILFLNTNDDRMVRGLVVTIFGSFVMFHNISIRYYKWKQNSATQKYSVFVFTFLFLFISSHVISIDNTIQKTDISVFALVTITLGLVAYFLEIMNLDQQEITDGSANLPQSEVNADPVSSPISESISKPIKQDSLISKYQEWINEHYNDVDATVEKAVIEIGTSYATLNRRLKEQNYPTSKKMLHEYRLLKAKELLKNENSSIVAFNTGFKTASHFTKSFKIHFGMTPSEYKKTI